MRDLLEDVAVVVGVLTLSSAIVWVFVRTLQLLTS